ncbi:MAG TPA: TetR/AcrR family transcriptional regulator [Bacteroidales bacterium]|nr:TetR/AcrR family transcriptional regulator [Bacteroidales bacterium]
MVNKEEYRKKIVIAAGQIFSRYGFKKTTMNEIAKAMKMGKSSVYYYFKSKEDIFEAVVLLEANTLRNELTTAIKSVESPIDKMKNYVFVRMKSFEKLSNYYNAIFDKNLDHFEFIETIREKYDREELAILRLILYHGAREKVFNAVNSEYTALAIQTTLKGLEVPLFWKKKEVNIESRLNAILDVLFYGIVRK